MHVQCSNQRVCPFDQSAKSKAHAQEFTREGACVYTLSEHSIENYEVLI